MDSRIKTNKQIADNVIILMISKGLSRVGTATMGLILVRLLSQVDYGSYLQFNLVFLTVTYLAIMSVPSTVYYYLPTLRQEAVKPFILQTLLILAGIGLLTGAGMYVLGGRLFAAMNNPMLTRYMLHLAALMTLTMMIEVMEPLFVTLRRPHILTFVSAAHAVANITCSVTALVLGYGLDGIIAVWVGLLAARLLFLLSYMAALPGNAREVFRDVGFREQLGYATPLGLGRATGIVSGKVDKFVISGFFSPAQYAIYARGGLSLPVYSIFVQNVANVILPRLVALVKEGRAAECLQLWHAAIKRSALVIMPTFAFVLFFASPIFVTLFTERYLGSVQFFRIFIMAMPLQVAVYGILHQAFGNTRIILFNNLIALACSAALSLGLYHVLGFIGPAVASTLTGLILIFMNLSIVKGYFKASWARVFPWSYLGRVLALSLALIAAVYPVATWAGLSAPFTVLLGAALYCPAYVLCCLQLGFVADHDRELLLSWLRPSEIRRKFKLAVS